MGWHPMLQPLNTANRLISRRSIHLNRAWRSGHTILDRHRHVGSYLALVLSGGYE